MREYEITYITDPGLAEDARASLNQAIDTLVADHGTISSNSESIRRKLMYPVRKQRVGFARTVQASLNPEGVATIREGIRKVAGVMRLSILQTTRREGLSLAALEAAIAAPTEVKPAPAAAAPAGPALTDEEVTKKIEQALDEEVK